VEAIKKIPVTVVVPVKNEERNLREQLPLLERFAQVIVVDSSSTDSTKEVVESAGATYLNFEWNGSFPKKRNWTLEQNIVSNAWVFFLDADELVNDTFLDALEIAVQDDDKQGYWLSYTNIFIGRQLKYGVPERKLALFRSSTGRYERIEEDHWAKFDMEIHEHPVLSGNIGLIKEKILHKEYKNCESYILKHIEYAKWESRRYEKLRESIDAGEVELTRRQKVKYSLITKLWFPYAYFFYAYVIKLGFMDGGYGLRYAMYKAFYFSTIGIMIKEKETLEKHA